MLLMKHLLNEDRGEILPGNDPMVHQLHKGRQCVGYDHVAPVQGTHFVHEHT